MNTDERADRPYWRSEPGQQQHPRSGARGRIACDGVSEAPRFGAAQQLVMVVFGKLLGGVWMHGQSSGDIIPELALVAKSQFQEIGSERR